MPALKNATVLECVRHWHTRDVAVAAQITLSIMLLIASLLMVRSLQQVLHLDLGFDPDYAVSVSFDLGLEGYSEKRGRIFQQEAQDRVAALPGISAAGVIDYMPLRIARSVDNVSIVDAPTPPRHEKVAAALYSISPGYFAAAGTRLVSGRAIDSHDRAHSPRVAVVNETFVRRLLGGRPAIGKRFRVGDARAGDAVEIVGVVQDGKYQSLGEDPTAAVYSPIAQRYNGWTTLVARTSLPPERLLQLVRSAILDLEPTLTLFNVGTLREQLAFPLFPIRVTAVVLGVFGVLAIVLSATGIFALVAHAVSRRTREIGIRMALGAGARQVLRAVLGRTFILWAIGSSLGSMIALTASQAMSAILYNVSPHDPVAYLSALLLTGAVAVLACLYPARRAVRISPAETIRQE